MGDNNILKTASFENLEQCSMPIEKTNKKPTPDFTQTRQPPALPFSLTQNVSKMDLIPVALGEFSGASKETNISIADQKM